MSFAVPDPGPDHPVPRPGPRREAVFAVRRAAPARRRFAWRRWLFSVLAVALLGGGAWALTQSGLFAVSRIGTGAYRFTDEHRLKVALSPLLGRNLWTVAQPDLAAAVTALPWVREVYMQRRWPHAIDIELIEWRPLLIVAEPGAPADAPTLVLVDDGRVLPFPAGMVPPALPVLTGVVVERSAGGPSRLPAELAPSVLELVAAFESTGIDAVTPVDFVVARPDGFCIVLQKDDQDVCYGTLLVGREDFANRLSRYLTARDHVERNLEIDLRFQDRLTVRPRPVPEGAEGDAAEGADGKSADGKSVDGKSVDGGAAAGADKAATARPGAAATKPAAKPATGSATAAAKSPAKSKGAKATTTKSPSAKSTTTKAAPSAPKKTATPTKTDPTRKSNTAMTRDDTAGSAGQQRSNRANGATARAAAGAGQ